MYVRRLRILLCFIGLLMLVLVGKIFYLQTVNADYYRRKAERNIRQLEYRPTRRGHLTDRRGRPLAVNETAYEVCVYLRTLERTDNARECLQALARTFGVDGAQLEQGVEAAEQRVREQADRAREKWRRKLDYKWLRRRVPQTILSDVPRDAMLEFESTRHRLPKPVIRGRVSHEPVFVIDKSPRRAYPQGPLGCHLIGYLGRVNEDDLERNRRDYSEPWKRYAADDLIGRNGAERAYETELRGFRGILRTMKDVRGRSALTLEDTPPVPGEDIRLTIDARLQRLAEDALDRQIKSLRSKRRPGDPPICGAVVLVDVHRGDVLAAASYPRYDLDTFFDDYDQLLEDPRHPLFHRAMMGLYPTGSVYKVVVAAAGLEEGVLRPSTTFECLGAFTSGRSILRCTGAHGSLELQRAIMKSCNVWFYNAGLAVGGRRLKTWSEAMGLGHPTGIEIPERVGQVPLPVTRGQTLNLAIGQGELLCSPLQVARLMGCLALNGKLPEARISLEKPIAVTAVPLHAASIRSLRMGMRDVVMRRGGTAYRTARVPGLEYAGKTGTAQTGKSDIYHAWFAGFAPFGRPRIGFACVIENSRAMGGGGSGPVMRGIFTAMLADPELRGYLEGDAE